MPRKAAASAREPPADIWTRRRAASRAFPAGAVPGGRQELAEVSQVTAVEDAGGGGDEGGARACVQRRGVAECVPPGRGAARAGDVLVKALGRAGAGDQV